MEEFEDSTHLENARPYDSLLIYANQMVKEQEEIVNMSEGIAKTHQGGILQGMNRIVGLIERLNK